MGLVGLKLYGETPDMRSRSVRRPPSCSMASRFGGGLVLLGRAA
jgi:hypothetical protein